MYRMRSWSVRNARWLKALYGGVEFVLRAFSPMLSFIGYERLDKPFVAVEKVIKGFLLDSQSCGQCIVGFTGMSCPFPPGTSCSGNRRALECIGGRELWHPGVARDAEPALS